MAIIKFSKEETNHIVPLIQNYLREELDCEVGRFDAECFLISFQKKLVALCTTEH